MSRTFTLKGNSSELSQNIYPPITLNPNVEYCLGLIGFHTFNTIPNIEQGNNKFYYAKTKCITIPTGSYEIEDIEKYIQNQLIVEQSNKTVEMSVSEKQQLFSLKPNNNTLKCEIKCKYEIDFTKKDSIRKLFIADIATSTII